MNLIIWGCGGGKEGEKICQGPGATVSGKATFENREVGISGFTGNRNFKAIRFADVEVVRNSDGAVLASGATDGNGFFCIDFGAPQTNVFVSVMAKTNHPSYNIQIKNLGDSLIHEVRSTVFNDQKGQRFTMNIPATVAGNAGAFNIMDVFQFGFDFARQRTGMDPPFLRGLWTPRTDARTGFNVDPNGAFIQIGGSQSDPNEYDRGIILHEFGHFLAEVYSKDDNPGQPHDGLENDQDIRLSFSEGWASFISSVMRDGEKNDHLIIDVLGGDPPNNDFKFIIDLESTSAVFIDFEVYTTNELAVAKSLWDIYDNEVVPEQFDAMNTGLDPIWDVLTNYLTQSGIINVSMEDFWEGWFLRGHNSLTEMENITKEFKMEFFEDSFEADNGPVPLPRKFIVNSPAEDHTLYRSDGIPDEDFIAFDAGFNQTYTIGTNFLKNGADTYLEILDSSGVLLSPAVVNDNRDGSSYSKSCNQVGQPVCPRNDQTTLSSEIVFTAPQSGLFYVKVKSSPVAPPSAGRLGTYRLLISSP